MTPISAIILGCAAFLFFVSDSCRASLTEARLHPDQVTFRSPKGELQVVLSGLDDSDLADQVRIKEKVIEVPKRFLFGAKEVRIESIRLRVPTPRPDVSLWKQAVDDGFLIYFALGGDHEHGSEARPAKR